MIHELDKENKNRLKEQRLKEYQLKYFALQIDLKALESTGDTKGVEDIQKRMEALEKAYEAVKVM